MFRIFIPPKNSISRNGIKINKNEFTKRSSQYS